MSKYKTGQKFIIEIGHVTVDPLYGARYFIKDFNTLVFDDYGLESLEQVNDGPTLREAYDNGFEKGLKEGRSEKDCKACMDAKANADYNSGYEDGLRDAWECARKITKLDVGNQYDAFGIYMTDDVIAKYSASEAIAVLKKYEAKQAEIKVGDEVVNSGDKGVVTRVNNSSNVCDVIWFDGSVDEDIEKKFLRKTGRHYDIKSILEQLKGEDEQ